MGVVFDDESEARPAIFLTPGHAKFEAQFKGVREAQKAAQG